MILDAHQHQAAAAMLVELEQLGEEALELASRSAAVGARIAHALEQVRAGDVSAAPFVPVAEGVGAMLESWERFGDLAGVVGALARRCRGEGAGDGA